MKIQCGCGAKYNLEITALGCPLRRGLDTAEDQQPRIEHVRKVLSLSFDLGARIAIVQAGRIPDERLAELQTNLILSHSCGLGEPLDARIVRLAMILKAIGLGRGHSGVRRMVVERILALVEAEHLPGA